MEKRVGVRQGKSAGRASVIGADAVATQLFRNRSCKGSGSSYLFRNLEAERQNPGGIFEAQLLRQGVRKGPGCRREAKEGAGRRKGPRTAGRQQGRSSNSERRGRRASAGKMAE